jgi:hypothetical protein
MNIESNISKVKEAVKDYTSFIAYIIEGFVFLILVFNFFVPSYHEIQDLNETIETKKNELSDLTEYANYLTQLADSAIDIEEEIVNYALPGENDVITLILTYEGLASQNEDVEVSPISLSPGVLEQGESDTEEDLGGTQTVEFEMEGKAKNEEAALKLIEEITKTRRIFDIQSLSWSEPKDTKDDDDENVEITLNISLATYYYLKTKDISSRSLVKQGQGQQEFISQLRSATVFEDLILEGIELGKEDLFIKESTQSART